MTTPEAQAVSPAAPVLQAAVLGAGGLPDLVSLTALANEFFRSLPGGADVVPAVLPSAAPGALPPPAPGAGPAPSQRSQPAPPPSAVTSSSPAPGGFVSPAPVPAMPYVPQSLPPVGASSAAAAPTAAADPALPVAPGLPAGSPVPMPTAAQLGAVASILGGLGAMGIAPGPAAGQPVSGDPAPPDRTGLDPVGSALFPELDLAALELGRADLGTGDPGTGDPGTLDPLAVDSGVPVFAQSATGFVIDEGIAPGSSLGELPAESTGFRPDLVPGLPATGAPFDPVLVRRDFPILSEQVHGHRLIWLDNAATTQKPTAVIQRLSRFYEHENSNIHRAAHALAARATDAYEAAREKVRRFLNAGSVDEIVFVRGTTEGINLIAQSWGRANITEGDEIVITWLEHHANIVPWQQLCAQTGAVLRVAPVDDSGQVILSAYEALLGPRTKLVSFTHVSNALGTITPAAEMIQAAHRRGVPVLLDGAQSVSHMPVDVQALDPDFFVFSGHKVFGPTGIGAVYGKSDLLADMPPWQGGGNMIEDVTFERTVYQPPPARFEAGTGNIADAVGLGAALDYVTRLGMHAVAAYEHELLGYATEGLRGVPGLRLIGTATEKAGVLSFVLDGFRTEDVGAALDREGIAVRAGHHCAQPILRRFGVESTVRPSLALYNAHDDVDALVRALHRITAGRS